MVLPPKLQVSVQMPGYEIVLKKLPSLGWQWFLSNEACSPDFLTIPEAIRYAVQEYPEGVLYETMQRPCAFLVGHGPWICGARKSLGV